MHSTTRFILPFIAIIAAAPAAAHITKAGLEPTRVVVSHQDLDLTNPADVQRLETRMRASIKKACPIVTNSLREKAHAGQCRQTARARAAEDTRIAVAAAQFNRQQFASNRDNKAVLAK